jgi:hypothetical protein
MARLGSAAARVKQRYDAALLDISRLLSDDQRHQAAKARREGAGQDGGIRDTAGPSTVGIGSA